MRKREIHSVAHWAMMFLLLMFPLLMVGVSSFNKNDDVVEVVTPVPTNDPTVNGFVLDNFYYLNAFSDFLESEDDFITFELTSTSVVNGNQLSTDELVIYSVGRVDHTVLYVTQPSAYLYLYFDAFEEQYVSLSFDGHVDIIGDFKLIDFSIYNYPIDFSNFLPSNLTLTDYEHNVNSSRYEVNRWINAFLDLPINAWYKSLMDVIGVGFTNSSVMNVIYVMPVYILWVFIFDVIVDCFLVIVKLPHKLLNRLSGGENE